MGKLRTPKFKLHVKSRTDWETKNKRNERRAIRKAKESHKHFHIK